MLVEVKKSKNWNRVRFKKSTPLFFFFFIYLFLCYLQFPATPTSSIPLRCQYHSSSLLSPLSTLSRSFLYDHHHHVISNVVTTIITRSLQYFHCHHHHSLSNTAFITTTLLLSLSYLPHHLFHFNCYHHFCHVDDFLAFHKIIFLSQSNTTINIILASEHVLRSSSIFWIKVLRGLLFFG